jgi:hypothetical protein
MVTEINAGLDGAGGSAPDYQQGIGVTTDSVQGTDVYAGKLEFQILNQITTAFTVATIRTYRKCCPKVNNAPWKGFDTGEVLYLGCTANCTPGGVWKVAHKFAMNENLYAVPVSLKDGIPDIVIPYKGGFEYLWAAYQTGAVATALLQRPVAAYVERVYQYADFSLLGMGV